MSILIEEMRVPKLVRDLISFRKIQNCITLAVPGREKENNNIVTFLLLFLNFVSTTPSGVAVTPPNLDLLVSSLFCFCSFH